MPQWRSIQCKEKIVRKQQDEKRESRWQRRLRCEEGKIGWILLWLLGVPIPVLFALFLLRGCT